MPVSSPFYPIRGGKTMSSDRKASIILLVFCLLWGWQTAMLPTATLKGTPGPQVVPWILVGLLAFLSILLFFQGNDKAKDKPKEPLKKAFMIFGLIALFLILIPTLGFVVGTSIGLFLILRLTVKKLPVAILTSVGTAVALYVIFKVLLHIALPGGLLI